MNSARTRSRAVLSARRALSGPGPPAWIHCGQLDQEPRRRPLGRIGVEGDVEPLGARVIDQREHRLGRARVRLAMVEVGDVGGGVGPPADLDRLAERVEVAVAERIADVGVVEAAVATGLVGQRGELLGRGVGAGRVVEARRQPEGAVGHRVGQDAAHPGERRGVGGDVVPAEGRDAELRVADERGDVEADRAVVAREVARDRGPVVVDLRAAIEAAVELHERLEVLAPLERREPVAIDPDELGGHALADLGLVAAVGQDHQPAVAVEVDEARARRPCRSRRSCVRRARAAGRPAPGRGSGRRRRRPSPVGPARPCRRRSSRR